MKAIERYDPEITVCYSIQCRSNVFSLWMKSYSVQGKVTKVILGGIQIGSSRQFMDEIVKCDYSSESSCIVLSNVFLRCCLLCCTSGSNNL